MAIRVIRGGKRETHEIRRRWQQHHKPLGMQRKIHSHIGPYRPHPKCQSPRGVSRPRRWLMVCQTASRRFATGMALPDCPPRLHSTFSIVSGFSIDATSRSMPTEYVISSAVFPYAFAWMTMPAALASTAFSPAKEVRQRLKSRTFRFQRGQSCLGRIQQPILERSHYQGSRTKGDFAFDCVGGLPMAFSTWSKSSTLPCSWFDIVMELILSSIRGLKK